MQPLWIGVSFLLVRDRSGVVQVVLAGADVGTVVETLPEETMIAVKGVVSGRALPTAAHVRNARVRSRMDWSGRHAPSRHP